jgi:hypothetical protein
MPADLLQKSWDVFMNAPVTIISMIIIFSGFTWWFRGFLDKRLVQIAKGQHEAESKEVARLKGQIDDLQKKVAPGDPLSQITSEIVVTVTSLSTANNALSTTLGIAPGRYRVGVTERSGS